MVPTRVVEDESWVKWVLLVAVAFVVLGVALSWWRAETLRVGCAARGGVLIHGRVNGGPSYACLAPEVLK